MTNLPAFMAIVAVILYAGLLLVIGTVDWIGGELAKWMEEWRE